MHIRMYNVEMIFGGSAHPHILIVHKIHIAIWWWHVLLCGTMGRTGTGDMRKMNNFDGIRQLISVKY